MRKIRGRRRQLHGFRNRLLATTSHYPEPDQEGEDYWHAHMPTAQAFLDYSNQPTRLRRQCVEILLQATHRLVQRQLAGHTSRVTCCINWPHLWDSQLIVFFSEAYFGQFFSRNGPWQTWEKQESPWLESTLDLVPPPSLQEQVYLETIREAGSLPYQETLIFVGQLD